ncbi:MAG: DUF2508 family protein [Clostridia bacterium]|nr:DUF2508 family protein [Clostridia bacterium]
MFGELEAVRQSLETVSSRFDCASDPDIVEACIYEMQALSSRYRYLLREARCQNLSRAAQTSLRRASN